MSTFETTATVQEQGRVLVAGVPFASGTEVEITMNPKVRSEDDVTPADDAALAARRARMQELFRTIQGFRMTPKIPREELYERGRLR
jgi:hypothetical protein